MAMIIMIVILVVVLLLVVITVVLLVKVPMVDFSFYDTKGNMKHMSMVNVKQVQK